MLMLVMKNHKKKLGIIKKPIIKNNNIVDIKAG